MTQKQILERQHIDLIFIRLGNIYGHLWTSKHKSLDGWKTEKDEWFGGLLGVTVGSTLKALDRLRLSPSEFPPNLPKFRGLCDESSGVPNFEKAFSEAKRGIFSHQVVEFAFQDMGSEARTLTEAKFKEKFKSTYEENLILYREHIAKRFSTNAKLLTEIKK